MNTVQTKGAYRIAQNFVEKGEKISDNNINSKIYKNYYQYLEELENKKNTIILKLMYMILPKILWYQNLNIRTYYTQDEISKLLNAIDTKSQRGKEDYLIISLICYLGLRISDIINLKLSNINFNNNTISIIQYKTNKLLTLPLIEEIKYPLLDYLKNVRQNNTNLDYVFITNTLPYRQKIEIKTYRHIVSKYLKKAGINIDGRKHGFHSLRHSFSTSLLKENVSLYSISTILGHTDIKSTMSYLDIDIIKLKELALEVPYVK